MFGLERGDLKKVADELGVSYLTVRKVSCGADKSKRIENALKELQKKRIKEFQDQSK